MLTQGLGLYSLLIDEKLEGGTTKHICLSASLDVAMSAFQCDTEFSDFWEYLNILIFDPFSESR